MSLFLFQFLLLCVQGYAVLNLEMTATDWCTSSDVKSDSVPHCFTVITKLGNFTFSFMLLVAKVAVAVGVKGVSLFSFSSLISLCASSSVCVCAKFRTPSKIFCQLFLTPLSSTSTALPCVWLGKLSFLCVCMATEENSSQLLP